MLLPPLMSSHFTTDFERIKKIFYKEIMRERKGEQTRHEMEKDANDQILRDGEVTRR